MRKIKFLCIFKSFLQIVFDHGMRIKDLNEIKSVLVSALASNGKVSDALEVYNGMKQAGCSIQNKTVLCLIVCITFFTLIINYYKSVVNIQFLPNLWGQILYCS